MAIKPVAYFQTVDFRQTIQVEHWTKPSDAIGFFTMEIWSTESDGEVLTQIELTSDEFKQFVADCSAFVESWQV